MKKRTGVAQSRKEHHSDRAEVGGSHPSPGTRWVIKWKEVLGLPECPYVYRWRFESPFGSIRIHHWVGPDDARHLHDHPWSFITFILRGGYDEITPEGTKTLNAFSIHYRPAKYQHSVQPHSGSVWTMIITGPRIRYWGFWVSDKFVKANKYFAKFGQYPCD
jgi:hypothetical protein